MISFLIESSLSLSLLIIIYFLFFRNDKRFVFKRYYLLIAILFSLSIPLLQFELLPPKVIVNNPTIFQSGEQAINHIQKNVLVPSNTYIQRKIRLTQKEFPLIETLFAIYFLGFAILLIRFLRNLRKIRKSILLHERIEQEGYTIILSENTTAPCSFLKFIILNTQDYKAGIINNQLINHEIAHIQQKHSYDILFIEITQLLFWFNPLFIFYKSAIKANHEYLADAKALHEATNKSDYYNTLINFSFQSSLMNLSSGFGNSPLKNRLIMMTKEKNKATISKMVLFVPLVLILTILIACKFGDIPEINPGQMKYKREHDIRVKAKVKTMRITSYYQDENGIIPEKVNNYSLYFFNKDGKESQSEHLQYDKYRKNITLYDENGEYAGRKVYDKNDKLINENDTNSGVDFLNENADTSYYDLKNKVYRSIAFKQDGDTAIYLQFNYNDKYQVICSKSFFNDSMHRKHNNHKMIKDHTYDNQGNDIAFRITDFEGKPIRRHENIYNEKNLVIEMRHYESQPSEHLSGIVKYQYTYY